MNKKFKNNIKFQSKDGEICIKPKRLGIYKYSISKKYYSSLIINLVIDFLGKVRGYNGFTSDKEFIYFTFKLTGRESYSKSIKEYLKEKRIGVTYLKELESEYSKIKKLDIVKQREIGKQSQFYTHMLEGKIVNIYPYWLELAISVLEEKDISDVYTIKNNIFKI